MTTTTHSHKHWTDKGGHVTRSYPNSDSIGPWLGAGDTFWQGQTSGTPFRVQSESRATESVK